MRNVTDYKEIFRGMRVRCYDFEPIDTRPDQYAEGTVIAVDKDAMIMVVAVEKDVVFTKNPRPFFTTPLPGYSGFMDYDGRIREI